MKNTLHFLLKIPDPLIFILQITLMLQITKHSRKQVPSLVSPFSVSFMLSSWLSHTTGQGLLLRGSPLTYLCFENPVEISLFPSFPAPRNIWHKQSHSEEWVLLSQFLERHILWFDFYLNLLPFLSSSSSIHPLILK